MKKGLITAQDMGLYRKERTMGDAHVEGGTDRYKQLKVAVQDMLIELRIFPEDLHRRVSPVMNVSDKEPVAELTVKVCQKLIDAGVWSKIFHFIHSKPSNMLHHAAAPDGTIEIETLRGTITAKKGDWIAKNSHGEICLNPHSTAILVASKHLDGSPPVPPMPPTSEIIKDSKDKPEGQ